MSLTGSGMKQRNLIEYEYFNVFHKIENKKIGVRKMNKTELVNAIAKNEGIEKKCAEKAVNAVFAAVADALAAGEKVQLIGFGTFEVRERAEKTARNPRTGETITVPATKAPAFKAGAALKAKIAK